MAANRMPILTIDDQIYGKWNYSVKHATPCTK